MSKTEVWEVREQNQSGCGLLGSKGWEDVKAGMSPLSVRTGRTPVTRVAAGEDHDGYEQRGLP